MSLFTIKTLPNTLLLSMSAIFAVSAQANTAVQHSTIKAVTIYQGSASVQRQLPIKATGEQHLVFGCLSGKVQKNSIQVTAPEQVAIGELNVQTLKGEDAKLCQHQGNQALKSTQADMDTLQAQLAAAHTSLKYLTNFSNKPSVSDTTDIEKTANTIQISVEKTLLEINILNKQKSELQRQLLTMKSSSGNTAHEVTQISVRLASPISSKLTLNYLVKGAHWQPQYQARLDTKANTLDVELQAVIFQQTGENWHDVPVILSTVQPNYQTSSNNPRPKYLSLRDSRQHHAKNLSSSKMKSTGYAADIQIVEQAELSYEPLVTNNSDIVEYRLPQKISIPSDGRQVTTKLDSQQQQATTWVRIVPNQGLKGFWYTAAPSFSKNWFKGDMNLYRDGNYVGSSVFNKLKIQQDGLGFGVNSQILVKEITDKGLADTKGLFNNTNVQTLENTYRITNRFNRSLNIEVVSGVPVITDTGITVTSNYLPPLSTTKWQEKEGLASWEFDLTPSASKNVTQKHIVEYPKDKEVGGL